jgi:predicted aspartyl protease
LEIYLSQSDTQVVGPLRAIVDTGSDGTIVPARTLSVFQPVEMDKAWLRSQWGERRLVAVYALDIHLDAFRLPAIRVVSDDRGNEIILGRDVLNKLRLLLDGPDQTIEMLEPKSKRK